METLKKECHKKLTEKMLIDQFSGGSEDFFVRQERRCCWLLLLLLRGRRLREWVWL